ncbi:myc target protein 1 homolog [Stigmatopora argus]
MAHNQTQPLLEIFKSFHAGDLILAFCLSALAGLILGALLYVLLTWASRRREARRSRRSRVLPEQEPEADRVTFIGVYRRPSPEPPPDGKADSRTSTFRPPSRKNAPAEDSSDSVADKRRSFWLGGNGLRGFLPSQTPPPTYNSVVQDDRESPAHVEHEDFDFTEKLCA